MEKQPTEVHVIRTRDVDTGSKIWVLADKTRTMWGKSGKSKRLMLLKWQKDIGPISKVITYEGGIMRTSEAVVTIASIKGEL